MVPPKKIWGNGSSVSFCVPLACSHPPTMVFLFFLKRFFVVVQSLSHVRLFATPWTVASLSFTISQSLLKLMSSESMMPSSHLILCCPLSSFPQSSPASGSFSVSQLFASGGQSIGASASVLPKVIQGRFPLGLTCLISLLSRGLSRVFSSTTT